MKSSTDIIIKGSFHNLSQVMLTEGQRELIRGIAKCYRRNKKRSEWQMATLFEIKRYSYEK